jgi:hypothetical protein
MGSNGLMLNVISPLQKPSMTGTTISHSLKQRFFDLFGRSMMQSTLNEAEEAFTGKKVIKTCKSNCVLRITVLVCLKGSHQASASSPAC